MYHLNTVQNDLAASHPRTLRIPNKRIRDIDYMRATHQTGVALVDYVTLRRENNRKLWLPPLSACPTLYTLAQDNLILFNNTPDYVYTFEVAWWEYSIIPDADTYTHWLFENEEELVEQLALYFAARGVRDFDRAAKILTLAGPELDDLLSAEEDKDLSDTDDVMQTDFLGFLGGMDEEPRQE